MLKMTCADHLCLQNVVPTADTEDNLVQHIDRHVAVCTKPSQRCESHQKSLLNPECLSSCLHHILAISFHWTANEIMVLISPVSFNFCFLSKTKQFCHLLELLVDQVSVCSFYNSVYHKLVDWHAWTICTKKNWSWSLSVWFFEWNDS